MRKIILSTIFSCITLMSSLVAQCVFPTYQNYGLMCDEARFLCGYEMNGFNGSLLLTKSPLPQPDPICSNQGEADNIQWFSFVPDDANLEIVISYSNCVQNILAPGLQVGIFENCELSSLPGEENEPLGSLYCLEGTNYTDIVLTPDSSTIVPGQVYYLFIDGYAGSACDFEININQGVCTDTPDIAQECAQDCGVIAQFPGNTSCTLFSDNYTFSPSSQIIADVLGCNPNIINAKLDSIICIDWEISPNFGFNIISSSFGYFDSLQVSSTLTVEWTVPGQYTIKPILNINPLYSTCQEMCMCTDDVVYTVDITESTVVELPEIQLCPGECVDFCSQTFCSEGDAICYKRDECLVEMQSFIERPNVEIDQGMFFLCPGECYEFQNVSYCTADNYEITDLDACDTTYAFQIETLDLSVDLIQSDAIINCTTTQAILEGQWVTNFTGNVESAWISESGDTLNFEEEYIATDGGDYTFVAWPEGRKECRSALTHTVVKDVEIPIANLLTPLLNCSNPADVLTILTQDALLSTDWTGPNGYVSNDINPLIDQAGIYEVVITATNGCRLVLTTEVIGNFETPDLDVQYDDLTCSENIPQAIFNSTFDLTSHTWTLPDGSNDSSTALNLDAQGNYSLEIVSTDGCENRMDFVVSDLSYDPSLQLSEDKIWRCLDDLIVLDLTAQEVAGLNYTWRTIEGSIVSNTINVEITGPGTYILTSEDPLVECVGSDTVRIMEDPNPFLDVEFLIAPPLCADGVDGSIDVMSVVGGEGPFEYEVKGEIFSDIDAIEFEAGMYTVHVTDAFGCVISKDVEVPKTLAFDVITEEELDIRFGQTKTLTFETSLDDSEIGFIEWTDDQGETLGFDKEIEFVGKQIEFINLRVEDTKGCEVMTQIRVELDYNVDIYFPNVFSPNGDGNNDRFIFYNNGFPEMADDLKIFDRSGELIYTSSQIEFNETGNGWDGKFNGQLCQPGVYVFILNYTLVNGERKTTTGSITLIR